MFKFFRTQKELDNAQALIDLQIKEIDKLETQVEALLQNQGRNFYEVAKEFDATAIVQEAKDQVVHDFAQFLEPHALRFLIEVFQKTEPHDTKPTGLVAMSDEVSRVQVRMPEVFRDIHIMGRLR